MVREKLYSLVKQQAGEPLLSWRRWYASLRLDFWTSTRHV